MTTRSSEVTPPAYLKAVAASAAEATLSGLWTASGELSTRKRRAAKAGILAVAALVATRTVKLPKLGAGGLEPAVQPTPGETPARSQAPDGSPAPRAGSDEPTAGEQHAPARDLTASQIVAVCVGLTAAAAVAVGGVRLEKRWLARLTRKGHTHPHRALAVRTGALSLAMSLFSRLVEARAAGRSAAWDDDRLPAS